MDKKLLEKYFTGGACSPQELAEVRAFLEHPDSQLQEFLDQTWQQAGGLVSANRQANTWQNILNATRPAVVVPMEHDKPAVIARRRKWATYWAAAAIIGILMIGGLVLQKYHVRTTTIASAAKTWKTIRNASEKVQMVMLPEGSAIWLNSHSMISYPEDFDSGNNREIRLSGEGYFEVTPNAARPFQVYTDSLKTTVLGTAFAIRAWPQTAKIQVALVQGSVQVSGYNGTISETLTPGHLLTFNLANREMKKMVNGVRLDMYAWKTGKMVLSNTPVTEVLQQLEQLYKVTIRYDAQQLAGKKLTGQFNREGIDTLLSSILFAADMTSTKRNGIYYITEP